MEDDEIRNYIKQMLKELVEKGYEYAVKRQYGKLCVAKYYIKKFLYKK